MTRMGGLFSNLRPGEYTFEMYQNIPVSRRDRARGLDIAQRRHEKDLSNGRGAGTNLALYQKNLPNLMGLLSYVESDEVPPVYNDRARDEPNVACLNHPIKFIVGKAFAEIKKVRKHPGWFFMVARENRNGFEIIAMAFGQEILDRAQHPTQQECPREDDQGRPTYLQNYIVPADIHDEIIFTKGGHDDHHSQRTARSHTAGRGSTRQGAR